jgi:carboxyl-terminal processing protease
MKSENENTISITNAAFLVGGVSLVFFVGGIMVGGGGALSDITKPLTNVVSKDSSTGLPRDLDYDSVESLYDELRDSYDGKLSEDKLINGLKKGLVSATGDPHTVYWTQKEADKFEEDLNGEFTGIGAELAIKNDQIRIISPLEGTPADKSGLRAGDIIIAINDKDTSSMTLDAAVSKIRGPFGTEVKLTILRGRDAQEFKIKRSTIVVPNAKSEIKPGNIGYIRLGTFGDESSSEMQNIATQFKAQGVKAVVLDLRNNGGGRLDSAVDIAGLWLDNAVVVEQRAGKSVESMRSGTKGDLYGIPTIVLINGGSASASEIVAGALKDHGAAKLLGERSFGKGSVQTIEEVAGGQLKVTTARWYTPKGVNIDKDGIKPDVKIELTDEDFNADRDPQLDKALQMLIGQ